MVFNLRTIFVMSNLDILFSPAKRLVMRCPCLPLCHSTGSWEGFSKAGQGNEWASCIPEVVAG